MAADILRPVYDETGGADGLVSLEVSPHLAHDTAGTISEAKRLVLYVEELIGPATVNTMPLATLNAFRDHGQPRASLTEGLDEAEADLDRLVRLEIDLAQITSALQREGVASFARSFDQFLEVLEQRRTALLPFLCSACG